MGTYYEHKILELRNFELDIFNYSFEHVYEPSLRYTNEIFFVGKQRFEALGNMNKINKAQVFLPIQLERMLM